MVKRRCCAWSKSASQVQHRLKKIVKPQEPVMALEVPDRVECSEDQTEAGAIHADLTFRWNTSVFILASIVGSANWHSGWRQALQVLSGTERIEGGPCAIAGAGEGGHLTDLPKPWRRVRKATGPEDVRIHDFRHSIRLGGGNGRGELAGGGADPRTYGGPDDGTLRTSGRRPLG